MPPDANVVKDLMRQNLLGVFTEHDAVKRRSLIAKIWDSKGIFIDPEPVTLDIQLSTMPQSNCSIGFPMLHSQSWRMETHTVVSDASGGASVHPASHGSSLVWMC